MVAAGYLSGSLANSHCLMGHNGGGSSRGFFRGRFSGTTFGASSGSVGAPVSPIWPRACQLTFDCTVSLKARLKPIADVVHAIDERSNRPYAAEPGRASSSAVKILRDCACKQQS